MKVLEIVLRERTFGPPGLRPGKKAPAAAQTHLNRAIIRKFDAYGLSALRAERPHKIEQISIQLTSILLFQ